MAEDKYDKCNTCMERRKPYPRNLRESESESSSGVFGFFSSKPKDDGCGCGPKKSSGDSCCEKKDSCPNEKKTDGAAASCSATQSTESFKCKDQPTDPCKKRNPLGSGAMPGTPIPASKVPALVLPAWFKCPPCITVPPFQVPCGVSIRPISEGGRGRNAGQKCDKCGATQSPIGPPKVSPNCPMIKNKRQCPITANAEPTKANDQSLLTKIKAMFGLGKKKEEGAK